MNYLLYSSATSTTGQTLLEELKKRGARLSGGTKEPSGTIDALIRWGSVAALTKKVQGRVINSKRAIVAASNKGEALKLLDQSGIRVPKLLAPSEVKPEHFPVLGRKEHHVAGNDIVLCLQMKDLADARKLGCTHFTKYIPRQTEFRVHVWGDDVIKVSEKVLSEPERNKDPWIANFDEGYIFVSPKTKLSGQAKGMAVDAVATLGLNFGAVDVILGDDGKTYVLEVNTAPGLQTDSSIEVYVNKIMEALK